MAEFVANNLVSETIAISPLFANYRLNLKINFEPDIPVNNTEDIEAYKLADYLSEFHDLIKSKMLCSQG
jgi:hypothetical protein